MKGHLLNPKTFGCAYFVILILLAGLAYSQESEIAKYPSRPISFIIPLPAGGGPDVVCRLVIKEAEKFLGQAIVPVNKPGGSFAIGMSAIAASKPDGYTVGFTGAPGLFLTPYMEKVPYHPVKDFKQIVQFGSTNLGINVKSDSPFKGLKDFIGYARQNPNKLTYGCPFGVGYLAIRQIERQEGIRLTYIPFKGSPESQVALLGGHIHAAVGDFNYPLIEAGQIRILALVAENRSTEFPQTPTVKDLGYDIPIPSVVNVAGPKGIPDEIAKKLEWAFTKAMKEQAFIKGMAEVHINVVYRDSKALTEYVAKNYELLGKVLEEMGLKKN